MLYKLIKNYEYFDEKTNTKIIIPAGIILEKSKENPYSYTSSEDKTLEEITINSLTKIKEISGIISKEQFKDFNSRYKINFLRALVETVTNIFVPILELSLNPPYSYDVEKMEFDKGSLEIEDNTKDITKLRILLQSLRDQGVSQSEINSITNEIYTSHQYVTTTSGIRPYWTPSINYQSSFCSKCGNNGTGPCSSSSCPNRIIVTYAGATWVTT